MAGNTEPLGYGTTGASLYAAIRSRTDGRFWNGTAMAAYADANWASYAVVMPEIGTSGIYLFTAPAALPADDYDFFVRLKAGATPALSDRDQSSLSDHWDGTALRPLASAGGAASDPWGVALPGAYAPGTAGGLVGNYLDAAVTSRPTAAEVDTELTGTHGAGAWTSGAAGTIYGTSGTLTVTITELDALSQPVSDVEVWISQDQAGTMRTQSEATDDLGQARFRLDPQDAWLWRAKAGFEWTPNPTPITIG